MEMDFWRRATGRSRRERVTNDHIKKIMEIEHKIVDDLPTKQLIWFGHAQRMKDQRIPKQIFKWQPEEKTVNEDRE